MSTMAVQLVVSVSSQLPASCQLPVPVASGDGDGTGSGGKNVPKTRLSTIACASAGFCSPTGNFLRPHWQLTTGTGNFPRLPPATDNWHWQLSQAPTWQLTTGTGNFPRLPLATDNWHWQLSQARTWQLTTGTGNFQAPTGN
jgi:hypothetical protein